MKHVFTFDSSANGNHGGKKTFSLAIIIFCSCYTVNSVIKCLVHTPIAFFRGEQRNYTVLLYVLKAFLIVWASDIRKESRDRKPKYKKRMYKILHILYLESTLAKKKRGSWICIPTSQKLPWDPQHSDRAKAVPDDAFCMKGQLAVLKDETKCANIKPWYDYCFWTEHHYFGWLYIQVSNFITFLGTISRILLCLIYISLNKLSATIFSTSCLCLFFLNSTNKCSLTLSSLVILDFTFTLHFEDYKTYTSALHDRFQETNLICLFLT